MEGRWGVESEEAANKYDPKSADARQLLRETNPALGVAGAYSSPPAAEHGVERHACRWRKRALREGKAS